MKRATYITDTFCLAWLLHPLLFSPWSAWQGWHWSIWTLLFAAPLGLLLSFPGYLLCLLLSRSVFRLPVAKQARLLAWSICCVVSIVASFASFVYLFLGDWYVTMAITFTAPGCLAALLSIVIRRRVFFQLIAYQIQSDEDTF